MNLCRLHGTKTHRYDRKIHAADTQICLKRLLLLYKMCPRHCENEAEFQTLYLIWNLGSVEALQHALGVKQKFRFVFLRHYLES